MKRRREKNCYMLMVVCIIYTVHAIKFHKILCTCTTLLQDYRTIVNLFASYIQWISVNDTNYDRVMCVYYDYIFRRFRYRLYTCGSTKKKWILRYENLHSLYLFYVYALRTEEMYFWNMKKKNYKNIVTTYAQLNAKKKLRITHFVLRLKLYYGLDESLISFHFVFFASFNIISSFEWIYKTMCMCRLLFNKAWSPGAIL